MPGFTVFFCCNDNLPPLYPPPGCDSQSPRANSELVGCTGITRTFPAAYINISYEDALSQTGSCSSSSALREGCAHAPNTLPGCLAQEESCCPRGFLGSQCNTSKAVTLWQRSTGTGRISGLLAYFPTPTAGRIPTATCTWDGSSLSLFSSSPLSMWKQNGWPALTGYWVTGLKAKTALPPRGNGAPEQMVA